MCAGGARKRERRYTPHLPVYETSKKVVRQEYVCACQAGKAGGKMSCKMNVTIGGERRLTKTKNVSSGDGLVIRREPILAKN
jgi:hypothetical protein